jgi:hypothetical protein
MLFVFVRLALMTTEKTGLLFFWFDGNSHIRHCTGDVCGKELWVGVARRLWVSSMTRSVVGEGQQGCRRCGD